METTTEFQRGVENLAQNQTSVFGVTKYSVLIASVQAIQSVIIVKENRACARGSSVFFSIIIDIRDGWFVIRVKSIS